jgi:hypothetical protein
MEYTLAFSSVNTVAVFLSRPRRESRISIEGFAASSARMPESYVVVSNAFDKAGLSYIHRRGFRPVSRTRLGLLARADGAQARSRVHFVVSPLMSPCRSSCDDISDVVFPHQGTTLKSSQARGSRSPRDEKGASGPHLKFRLALELDLEKHL